MKSLLDLAENAFGNIDALEDILLEECFEEHEAYVSLLSFSRFLAIGKKGSGKTAIFRKIIGITQHTIFSNGYNLQAYPWHYHELQARMGVPENEKYIQSWMYLLLIASSRILVNDDQSVPFDKESKMGQKILQEFLIDTYGTTDPDIINLFSPRKKLKFSALKATFKGVDLPIPSEIEMNHLPTVIQDVNKTLLRWVLQCTHPDHKYYICFDELDIGFEAKEEYYSQIIGLLKAARTFNLEAKAQNKQIEICIFLRDDIYDVLKFEDKRKFTSNCVARIEWDTERTKSTLKQLMEKRFTTVLAEKGETIYWEDLFDGKSINGKYSKYNYIAEMTCLRPRDIIDYCNIILEYYKERAEKGVNNKFENSDIVAARVTYSTNLLDEFDDEIHKHIPLYEDYLEIIKKLGKSKFDYGEFVEVFNKHSKELDVDAETCLSKLYNFSILGNYIVGGNKGGSQKKFKYKSAKNKLDIELPIIVHSGLVPRLALKEK